MTLEQRLMEATKDCLIKARPWLLGLGRKIPTVEIRCDLKGRTAGKVSWRSGTPTLIRYNLTMAKGQETDFIRETVPHEVAHILCHLLHPKARPHGLEWQAIMVRLGVADPKRCHTFDTQKTQIKQQRRWRYSCGCREYQLSTTRHFRILRGESHYHCNACKAALRPLQSIED